MSNKMSLIEAAVKARDWTTTPTTNGAPTPVQWALLAFTVASIPLLAFQRAAMDENQPNPVAQKPALQTLDR